jgi:DNA-3-methyladenine glycosylase
VARGLIAALEGDVVEVARRLLGWRLGTSFGDEPTEVRIVETEAYAGDIDPASHAFRGETGRNASMFGPPGTLYVYRSYGIHWCMNVVVRETGTAHAVLLRAGEPTRGTGVMEKRRGRADHLCDGPGKLAQALGVTGDQDGTSLQAGQVRLTPDVLPVGYEVAATPRVGITKAVDRPWRFVAVAG